MDARVEGGRRAAQGFERHGSGEIGERGKSVRCDECERPYSAHGLGAVQKREALLRLQLQWLDTSLRKGGGGSQTLAAKEDFALSDQTEREMREWREIAACAYRSARRDDRVNACIQEVRDRFDQQWPNAAVAFGKNIGAQQKHGACLGFREGLTDAGAVAAYEIDLQCRKLVGGDADVRQLAEAGVDAVGGSVGSEH